MINIQMETNAKSEFAYFNGYSDIGITKFIKIYVVSHFTLISWMDEIHKQRSSVKHLQ